MPRGFFPQAMRNFTPWLEPVPAPSVSTHDEQPARCIRISEALIPYLLGMLELTRYEHVFTGSEEDKLRAMIVFQDLAKAFALEDACIDCEDNDMYRLRQNPENACQLEQSTDGGLTWSLAFDYLLCFQHQATIHPDLRYNEQYDFQEVSYDGGQTYLPSPDDPRYKRPHAPNWTGLLEAPACISSANAVEQVRQFSDVDDDQALAQVIALLIDIFAVIITGGLALPIVVLLGQAIVNIGIDQIQASLTVEEYAKLRKNLFCHASPDGSWTLEAFFSIIDQLSVDHAGNALFFFKNVLLGMGWTGLNNAGQMRYVTEDNCDDIQCEEWWYEFDFTVGDFASVGWSVDLGEYIPGEGYRVQSGGCQNASKCLQFGVDKHLEFPGSTLIGYIIDMLPVGSGNFYWSVFKGSGGGIDNYNGIPAGLHDRVNVWFLSPSDVAWATLWGMGNFDPVLVRRVVLHGMGANPFGADNYTYDPENP